MTISFTKAAGLANSVFDSELLLTPKQAAAKIGMSEKTLMSHVEKGNCRYIDIGTRSRKVRRFTPYILARFLEKLKRKDIPCPSINDPALKPIATISSSKVYDFLAIPKPSTKKKLKQ